MKRIQMGAAKTVVTTWGAKIVTTEPIITAEGSSEMIAAMKTIEDVSRFFEVVYVFLCRSIYGHFLPCGCCAAFSPVIECS